jgi:nitrous-oxide reductase
MKLRAHVALAGSAAIIAALAGCGPSNSSADNQGGRAGAGAAVAGASADVQKVIAERQLTPDDVYAAVKTYTPSGRKDEFIIFASGGHSGQVFAIGVPSMRLLRSIAVFTPEPWQGWGYGVGNDILDQGNFDGHKISWADTHHPALSETGGDYDGQWLFINDKANARVAVIDLRDWETKQIVKNPIALNDHGGAICTPNSDYIVQGGQYASPFGNEYAPISDYQKSYRGMVTLWKFDREKGRVDPAQSFALELPPYWQDLFDAGKLVSEGWIFGNSFNAEMATGGVEEGKPPFEAGASQRDSDYLHVINLKRAAAVAAEPGKTRDVKGFRVIPLETSIAEGLLYFIPEPKSPHGVDVTPGGEYIVVSGKLDPHVTVYSFDKIQKAIADKKYSPEQFGVPVLDYDSTMEAQVEVGLGPLHTQFDDKGYAYTSLFLEPAVARWSLAGPYEGKHPEKGWGLVGKVNVQYNIGHLGAAEGDTVHPQGKYLVAFNKWSIDRFVPTGPLLPQNFQLVDIEKPGDSMKVLYDMPMGVGEPHYAQMIRADKLKTWEVYPEIGWDPAHQRVDPAAPVAGKERIERNGSQVDIYMTAARSHYSMEHISVKQGDKVVWHITNVERAKDATHGFALCGWNIQLSLEPGETETFEFVADRPGTYPYYCTEFCSALHLEMMGYFLVEPSKTVSSSEPSGPATPQPQGQ